MTDNSANRANPKADLGRPNVVFEKNTCTCNDEAGSSFC